MDLDDVEMYDDSDEVKDSETDRTLHDDDDANMMCDDDVKQEPPDHIKLVMEVLILSLLMTDIDINDVFANACLLNVFNC